MSRRISPGLDDKPIELNEDERKVVEALNMKLWAIQLATMKEKAQFLREVARRQGLIAPTLKELKSESGKPFVERKIKGIRRGGDYRRAVVEDLLMGRIRTVEIAYLCQSQPFLIKLAKRKKDKDGCGWVKGRPVEKPYDNIGVLSGSYHCRVCDKEIGRRVDIMS
ncbi:MAG: hypothetical protein A2896_01765 [Candidatus Nealsonbacteria bacterium RIFCSPLOWO2_01_FULL_43_32]|uniref:Uncharacterized protein n=1 Tax=Candidatus Nealsonbacteria bacterium RIFCSPLOWO2_01_FULL_43_32 TaxID=1801672 RepID=A0A1G2EG72_9BACT|nr:MAG: hypothetical protein A2896_01765 [Candidatus Nealsonbacteria bacterium RIFCSPLOWO2_01_FULL_43_32]